MPNYHQFVETATGRIVSLNEIDQEICKDLKIPVDPERFCFMYQTLTVVGDIVYKTGVLNESVLKDLTKESPKEMIDLYRKYLCGKYTYRCWCQR